MQEGEVAKYKPIEALAGIRREFGEHGGVNLSIEASSTFTVMEAGLLPEIFQGKKGPEVGGCYLYGRHFNPTVYTLGRELAAIEGTQAGYCTASGMAAISSVITQLCSPGDHIVASNTLYGGSYAFMHDYLPLKNNINTSFVDISDHIALEAAITDSTKVLYVESMANPTLMVADIPKLSGIARRHGLTFVVDNTFTPLIISPARLGADIVVHSLTKYINGASDIIAGGICGSNDFIAQLMDLHTGSLMLNGPTMDPKVAFEISLRIPHLAIRIKEHSRRALAICQHIKGLGVDVVYPGLSGHPDHELFATISNQEYGCGGLFVLDLGSVQKANEFMNHLQNKEGFGYIAVSLGYFDTLMSCSGSSTSSEMTDEDLAASGISPGLVRMSTGYTGSLNQRIEQLERALSLIGMI